MPSINGHGAERAILYTRVSDDEQKKRGYSLFDQRDALRAWASENGYEVVEEIEDAGYFGAYLERPGLDKVRELVRSGEADVVVLFRDRIARGVYAQLLAEEFRQHGTRLVALNSRGDDSPDGELGDNILDVIAAWERKKIAERMNRGKRRKAKEGKIIAGPSPDYGFRYNENRDGYVVDDEKMSPIRRIFRMVGAEGVLNASGRKGWSRQYLRTRIEDDVYLSHTFEEVSALVSPEVAASRPGAKLRRVVVRHTAPHHHAEAHGRSGRYSALREDQKKRAGSERRVDSRPRPRHSQRVGLCRQGGHKRERMDLKCRLQDVRALRRRPQVRLVRQDHERELCSREEARLLSLHGPLQRGRGDPML